MRPVSNDALPRHKFYVRAFDSAGIFCWGFQVWAINLEQAQVSAETFAKVEPRYRFDVEEGPEPSAVITYTDEPSPETGDVGWCWWADGSMGCAPTYEDACRAAEAAIYRRIANRMAVM